MTLYGPKLKISEEIHSSKYRGKGETFKEAMSRIAGELADSPEHYQAFRDALLNQRFLPAGRVQAAIGSPREVTAYNCFVSGTILDDSESIMDKAKEAFQTMRLGGGIGYDFSTLRPRGSRIKSLDSQSSGPLSFMDIYNSVCGTVSSAGHRRGAQMGVLRVDHPDIEEFIRVKQNSDRLTNFNLSVAVTDSFMEAVKVNGTFPLVFNNEVYKVIRARPLWEELMRSTWDWAEPGVLFIDTINKKNNLWYCETIAATNPCGEQPLPPYGACLLGSFNLVKYAYVKEDGSWDFDWVQFKKDIRTCVRAVDNIIDRTTYPLPQQEVEAKSKRRMGLGLTGVANCIETVWDTSYGTPAFLQALESILKVLRNVAYRTSIQLAKEKGAFPLYDTKYLEGQFIRSLPQDIRDEISSFGIRNSHLLSIAPTGTISLTADNVSSSIEPVFTHRYTRTLRDFDGTRDEEVTDFAYREWGIKGRTADQVSPEDHVKVLNLASRYVDSAVSKTCNIGPSVTWEEFKNVYIQAYEGGASGCTTFRSAGKRYGVLNAVSTEPREDREVLGSNSEGSIEEGQACYFDPETGRRSCE